MPKEITILNSIHSNYIQKCRL